MDQKTREALEGSIQKWKNIRDHGAADLGDLNCPLCKRFLHTRNCFGCPVATSTGAGGCYGTPFTAWLNHHHESHGGWETDGVGRVLKCDECLRLVDFEIRFLEGLRDVPPDEEGQGKTSKNSEKEVA